MIRVLLDTDHVSLHERGYGPLRTRLASFAAGEVAVSAATMEEMLRGRLAILARRSEGGRRVHAYGTCWKQCVSLPPFPSCRSTWRVNGNFRLYARCGCGRAIETSHLCYRTGARCHAGHMKHTRLRSGAGVVAGRLIPVTRTGADIFGFPPWQRFPQLLISETVATSRHPAPDAPAPAARCTPACHRGPRSRSRGGQP